MQEEEIGLCSAVVSQSFSEAATWRAILYISSVVIASLKRHA